MKELRVTPIKDGTVIDHIPSGLAVKVLKILGIIEKPPKSTVTVAMHVSSKKMKWKDIVKIEDRELDTREVNKIALIAPNATISIIHDFSVVKKTRVQLPDTITNIVKCPNQSCITNKGEPVDKTFSVVNRDPVTVRCKYCERVVDDIIGNFI